MALLLIYYFATTHNWRRTQWSEFNRATFQIDKEKDIFYIWHKCQKRYFNYPFQYYEVISMLSKKVVSDTDIYGTASHRQRVYEYLLARESACMHMDFSNQYFILFFFSLFFFEWNRHKKILCVWPCPYK